MTVTAPSSSTTATSGTRPLAIGVLIAAILQVVAPLITLNGPGDSPAQGSGPDLLITPVGWAFSIWGVIYTLAILQAIAVLVRGADAVPRRLQVAQIVLYLGGAVWIGLAGIDSSLATAAALAVMAVAGVLAVLTVARASIEPAWLRLLSRVAVGLYAGWVTAAFFLNASTALVDAGAFSADDLTWQLVVLGLATLTLAAVVLATQGVLAYAAAGAWALLGIAVTGSADGTTEVLVGAIIAAIVLAGVTVLAVSRGAGRNATLSS